MANIKFSDFTVGNTEGDIDFVVGYKGANNIQISPTNLLASALGNYLPLAGGTMNAGSSVLFPDNSFLRFGSCLLYTSPSPRDRQKSRMPSSA